jgi:hypothetical protein
MKTLISQDARPILRKFYLTFHGKNMDYAICHAKDEQDAMEKVKREYGNRWNAIFNEEDFDEKLYSNYGKLVGTIIN